MSAHRPSGKPVLLDSRHNDGGQPTPGNGFEVGSLAGPDGVPVCSSALGWEDPGFRFYMQSAAHCVNFANNHTIQFDGNPYNAGTYSGYIATLYGNPNYCCSLDWLLDATLIGVPATPSIAGEMFTGSNTSSTKVDIRSISAMVQNTTYCANGAATGTHCNVRRTHPYSQRLNFCAPSSCYLDVVQVYSTNGALMFGEGDSGGNVYRASDGRVVATITAGNADYYCLSANYYGPDTICTNTSGWVTEVTRVASELAETNPDLVSRLRP